MADNYCDGGDDSGVCDGDVCDGGVCDGDVCGGGVCYGDVCDSGVCDGDVCDSGVPVGCRLDHHSGHQGQVRLIFCWN